MSAADEHPFRCDCAECLNPTGGDWSEWDHHGGDDTVFSVSGDRAAERVTGLVEQLRALEWELELTVGMWKLAGGSWQGVADALSGGEHGSAGAKDRFGSTKQAASQRFRRGAEQAAALLDDAQHDDDGDGARAEFLRLARAIGARPRPYRYELHTARAAKGEPLSRHRSEEAATAAAIKLDRRPVYIVRVDPRPNQRPEVIAAIE